MTAPVLQPGPRFSGAPACRLTSGPPPRAPGLYVTVIIDGVHHGPFGPAGTPTLGASDIQIGAAFNFAGAINDLYLDNILIGTTGLGSSDIFACDFSAAIVPPFDSTVITDDGALAIVSGALHLTGTTDSEVVDALKDFGALHQLLFVQLDVQMAADMIAAGGQTGDFFDISFNGSGDVFAGMWFDLVTPGWGYYANTSSDVIPFSPTADTWYTIGMKLEMVT